MATWLHAQTIPSVPDDRHARRKALSTATRQLAIVKARDPEITSVVESVQRHTERNHFIERLEWAYGRQV